MKKKDIRQQIDLTHPTPQPYPFCEFECARGTNISVRSEPWLNSIVSTLLGPLFALLQKATAQNAASVIFATDFGMFTRSTSVRAFSQSARNPAPIITTPSGTSRKLPSMFPQKPAFCWWDVWKVVVWEGERGDNHDLDYDVEVSRGIKSFDDRPACVLSMLLSTNSLHTKCKVLTESMPFETRRL